MQKPQLVREPIVEAVIEVRFPGDARVECWRGEYQQEIRGEYLKMYVPRVGAGEQSAPALMHYRFYNEGETRFVAIASNSLAFGTTQYPGWHAFRDEFLKHWGALKTALDPAILTRIGMRFTNTFQPEANGENGGDTLAQVRFDHSYLKVLESHPMLHQSVTRFQRGSHQVAVQTLFQEASAELVIGYDFAVVNSPPSELEKIVEELHDNLENEFFGSITEDLAQSLRPTEGGRTG